tara:strand:+ start:241 stop:351 length:111 start_codon:yes stop_codon:yes gene_type:complete
MQQRNGRDVYVMGAANVGKSLFIGMAIVSTAIVSVG